jgi:hypothetical protein
MANWQHRVKVKHLMTEDEDHKTVQENMNAIADVLDKSSCFSRFDTSQFRSIPEGDSFFGPVDYANRLLSRMYDFADFNLIWIE